MKDIKIASIFNTIQGEGRNQGQAVTFIRLFTEKCFDNGKRCTFCDTVSKPYYKESYTLTDLKKHNTLSHIVITGGEPLSLGFDSLNRFITYLYRECNVEQVDIETNGSYLNSKFFSQFEYGTIDWFFWRSNTISLSPKLANSGVDYPYDTKQIGELYKRYPSTIDLKFVIDTAEDVERAVTFQTKCGVDDKDVFFMPKTNNGLVDIDKFAKVATLCTELGVNFSPRLHMILWPAAINYEV